MTLSRFVKVSVSSLCGLDTKAYNLFDRVHRLYDAALLIKCYTLHALRPYIDFEVNHIRHFMKIQFVIKGSNS